MFVIENFDESSEDNSVFDKLLAVNQQLGRNGRYLVIHSLMCELLFYLIEEF